MINKKIFLIISLLIFTTNSFSIEKFNFYTENLKIIEQNKKIISGKGRVVSSDDSMEIFADNFEYLQIEEKLNAYKNGEIFLKKKNIKIKFDNGIINQISGIINLKGNIKMEIPYEFITFETENLIYHKENNSLSSNSKSILKDKFNNIYFVDNFLYLITENLVKVENLKIIDKDNNVLETNIAYINTQSGNLFGKDLQMKFDKSLFSPKNDPRLKGNSFSKIGNITQIKKGVFTTCKIRDNCPPWELQSSKIIHNGDDETFYYDNALLKVYDFPVMYFPKFFHPAPSVKRRSGFLTPGIKTSPNSGNFFNLPYYLVIAENKDATFSPRFYSDNEVLIQTEYRQKNNKSNHIADFSFFKSNKNKNHFFYSFDKEFIPNKNFNNGEINIKLQKTSNDTYLKSSKIDSELIKDKNVLENSLDINLLSSNLNLNLNTTVFENLNEPINDKYEYIFPKISLIKSLNNKTPLNGDFNFNSEILVRNYNTNFWEKLNYNELSFDSNSKISKNGLEKNYQFLIKNLNSNNKKTNYKNNKSAYISGIFQYNTSLPMAKESKDYQKIITPKLNLKIAPEHTKNERNSSTKVDINNVFSINRLSSNSSTEGGVSVTYGNEYSVFDKTKQNKIIDLELANNLRFKKNEDLSRNNQMGEKTSNVFGKIDFNPNEIFSMNYNFILKNDLRNINNENLIADFHYKKLKVSFDYLNENNLSKNSYITNKSSFTINQNNSISFSTRKNKTKDLTEYYNFMYEYKNDCLSASIQYDKDFYNDRELKPQENLLFKLTIIPFAETSTPNLKQ